MLKQFFLLNLNGCYSIAWFLSNSKEIIKGLRDYINESKNGFTYLGERGWAEKGSKFCPAIHKSTGQWNMVVIFLHLQNELLA